MQTKPITASSSNECYDRYSHIKVLPAAMRDEIGKLAGHFYGTAEFESVFVGSLVPWNELVGQPNDGHAAVADFLVSRAAAAALSANFDTLIGSAACEEVSVDCSCRSGLSKFTVPP
jgi:hypothetical protein